MLDNIEVLYHSSIRINKEKIIYIDPFKIDRNFNDADIIFITHDHYDHYSEEDIEKVINENTTIIIPEELLTKQKNFICWKVFLTIWQILHMIKNYLLKL